MFCRIKYNLLKNEQKAKSKPSKANRDVEEEQDSFELGEPGIGSATAKLGKMKEQLDQMLTSHYEALAELLPLLPGQYTKKPPGKDHPPITPAHFSEQERQSFNLVDLAKDERDLRTGHGHDILENLRDAIGFKAICIRQSRETRGYVRHGRTEALVRRSQKVVDQWIKTYNLNWGRLSNLGPENASFSGLRPLKKEDTTSMSTWLVDRKYADAGTELPWIWVITRLNFGEQDGDIISQVKQWNEEGTCARKIPCAGRPLTAARTVVRLQYLHRRALLSRWDEECVVKKEESRRIGEAFWYEEKIWRARAGQAPALTIPLETRRGFAAFAMKQAAMYKRMAESADQQYQTVCTAPTTLYKEDSDDE